MNVFAFPAFVRFSVFDDHWLLGFCMPYLSTGCARYLSLATVTSKAVHIQPSPPVRCFPSLFSFSNICFHVKDAILHHYHWLLRGHSTNCQVLLCALYSSACVFTMFACALFCASSSSGRRC